MNKTATILAIAGIGALALYAANASAAYVSGDAPPMLPPPDDTTVSNDLTDIANMPDQASQIQAFQDMIGKFESNGDYSILYGGGHFSDYSKHPNVRVPFYNPRKPGPQGVPNDYSTAAGKYQINYPTYQEFAPGLGLTDFSPSTQEALAFAILQQAGAIDALLAGDLPGALQAASRRWASVPGSTSGQRQQTVATATQTYYDFLNNV